MLKGPKEAGGKVVSFSAVKRSQHVKRKDLHGIFRLPSYYAVTFDLVHRLSRDSVFKIMVKRYGLRDLYDLGERILHKNEPFYLKKDDQETALRIFERFSGGRGRDALIFVISNNAEMWAKGKRFAAQEILFKGERTKLPSWTIKEHMQALRWDFQVVRLMDFAYGEHEECALEAIDALASVKGSLYIQKMLTEISSDFEGERSARAWRARERMAIEILERKPRTESVLIEDIRDIFEDVPRIFSRKLQLNLLAVRLFARWDNFEQAHWFFHMLRRDEREPLLELMLKDKFEKVRELAKRLRELFTSRSE